MLLWDILLRKKLIVPSDNHLESKQTNKKSRPIKKLIKKLLKIKDKRERH